MKKLHVFLIVAALFACGTPPNTAVHAPNRWTNELLLPVLEAQEHRNTKALCDLLKDPDEEVREAAALAFASVQDSASIPCLLTALRDTGAGVRATAAFALGFIADSSTVLRMAESALAETDTTVQRALLDASFIAMQRNGQLSDINAILYYMDHAHGHACARAADALRRMPDSVLYQATYEIEQRMGSQKSDARQFLILAMRKMGDRANRTLLGRLAWENPSGNERVNAQRVYGALYQDEGAQELLLGNAMGPCENQVVLDALQGFPEPELDHLIRHARQRSDTLMRIGLMQLVMERCDEHCVDSVRAVLRSIETASRNPYVRAAAMVARANAPQNGDLEAFMTLMRSHAPSVERQAALGSAIRITRSIMERSRFSSQQAQYAQLKDVLRAAMNTGDPGLICATAEVLAEEDADVVRIILDRDTETKARTALEPIRDLEALILLEKLVEKRDGLAPSEHQAPPYNHPIDPTKLQELPQGQRYRISTPKGEIIIATDVNECPGSSLAFDSLVQAGYYDGKSFHRMVPNFVVQGGCPRGDGYGGMPWTLRTEIGRTPFTAGSVGLASAGRDTESCQFFITHSATPHLDGRYTRFGEVVSGMDVLWKLQVGDVMTRVERVP